MNANKDNSRYCAHFRRRDSINTVSDHLHFVAFYKIETITFIPLQRTSSFQTCSFETISKKPNFLIIKSQDKIFDYLRCESFIFQ